MSHNLRCIPTFSRKAFSHDLLCLHSFNSNKSHVNYGSQYLLSSAIAQEVPGPYHLPSTEPSAPPMELVDNVTGAERDGSRDCEKNSLPAQVDLLSQGEHNDSTSQQNEWSIPPISEHEAREAFLEYAASKCCYRTAPAKHMVVQNLTACNTYRYRLKTFTENRETYPASEPYNGGFVDSPEVAEPPAPWEIEVDAPPLFTDCEMHFPVPHTYSVQSCPKCHGTGKAQCTRCTGSGKVSCSSCNGSGWQSVSTTSDTSSGFCTFCGGVGRTRCSYCYGRGWLHCVRCNGRGLLLYHSELTIIWKNNSAEYVADNNCGFPIDRFHDVTGKEIFCDENVLVNPLRSFPEPEIVRGSESCIATHKMQFASKMRILRQKQTVELIPLARVEYVWKGKSNSFYIFGNEKKVYAKDYPAKCCCLVM
ncbi:PREDICTED: protein SSUH2 homolog isoform X1 [Gavialis gangeticus]|uniref:protein SSUH2 homolog isoform X1 n=2 Tax=Gavialis gangeticus TaxID=94835 RepID=UPI00092E56E5|nr:PREDICTED: protein SSUH2 homolog isoform X1 [Gavialis gangeticus]